jgi:hypothetical membrane protein
MRLGALMWLGCLQYFVAEAVCIHAWRGAYSLSRNFISDLGASACETAAQSDCSPLRGLMNASFVAQGLLLLIGTVLSWPAGPRSRLGRLGLILVAASGLGVFVVGLAPEDSAPAWHYAGAAENFIACNLGALVVGAALVLERPTSLRIAILSMATGIIGLAGVVLISAGVDFGFGRGAIERLAAYPFPLWIATMGALRLRRDAAALREARGTSA